MRAPSPLPAAGSGTVFLTEGGSETEIMYRHGFELPEFALFPLLDIPSAVAALRDMFRAQLDVAAEFGLGFLLTGLDYRASPDWGAKLGYSARSEEHTSELQSLMRISYAVFCLNKKKSATNHESINL